MNQKKFKSLSLIDLIIPEIENRVLSILKDILLIFSFSFLTGISAQLKIEIGIVPITMQTFIVLLSGALLGSKRGTFSQVVYLIFGLTLIPWFSRGGGIFYLFSPTFGYLIGFIFCSYTVGFLFERGFDKNIITSIFAMLIGNITIYIPGILWLSKFIGFENALKVGFYPFIIGDLLKIFLAGLIFQFAFKLVKK
ncbi:MAG: biotin transporter BioY [candidate division WOR-3 bacterium]